MIRLSVLFAVLGAPAFAFCPDPSREAIATYATTGAELLAPKTWPVYAGGSEPAPCSEFSAMRALGDDRIGFMSVPPTAAIDLEGMAPHILIVSAQADCGPVLTIYSGDGQWYFGEAAQTGQAVTLWGVPDGPLRVWIGTSTPNGCTGSFTLETFDR